jgi:hypothetical protein
MRRQVGQPGRGHCLVCADPRQLEINAALALGRPSLRKLAAQFQIGAVSLGRHRQNHLSPALVTAGRKQDALRDSAKSSVHKANALVDEALASLRRAKRSQNEQQVLASIREARGALEFYAKLTGELDERPTLVVNLAATEDWIRVRTALLMALIPFPEAARAAADAIAKVAA